MAAPGVATAELPTDRMYTPTDVLIERSRRALSALRAQRIGLMCDSLALAGILRRHRASVTAARAQHRNTLLPPSALMPRTHMSSRLADALRRAKVALKGHSNDAEHDALSDLVEALETPSSSARLAIVVEGGLVQSVISDAAESLDVLLIDYDVEGSDESDVHDVPQDDGSLSRAAGGRRDVESVESVRLDELFRAFEG